MTLAQIHHGACREHHDKNPRSHGTFAAGFSCRFGVVEPLGGQRAANGHPRRK